MVRVIEKIKDDLLLCEIPDVSDSECTLKVDGKEFLVELNINYAGSFSELREMGWKYIPIKLSAESNKYECTVDSVLICKERKDLPLYTFLRKYSGVLYFEEIWFVIKGVYIYVFGWWD